MNLSKALFIIWLLVGLSACNSTVTNMTVDADTIGADDTETGYLLIGVETNISLKDIEIDGPDDIALSHDDLKSGTNFILVPLRAGDYEVRKVTFNNRYRALLRGETDWSFKIKPQTISYVGHLEISAMGFYSAYSRIELVNRSTEALDFMEQDFPAIFSNRELFYGGPGNDTFFDFVKTLGE